MARSSSPDAEPQAAEPVAPPDIGLAEGRRLVAIAGEAIRAGLAGRDPVPPALGSLPSALRRPAGSFVTVRVGGELNGCIGSIEPSEPLATAVARHARAAAFDDPRLPALRPEDCDRSSIEVSVLSPLVPLPAPTRAALVEALRPGLDGLVVADGERRAVFLPVVWDSLPDPEGFVSALFAKAGFDPQHWSPDVRAWTFTAVEFHGEPTSGDAAGGSGLDPHARPGGR